MCGRYSLGDGTPSGKLADIIGALNRRGAGIKTSGEVFPTDVAPVIASSRSMKPGVFAMRWGYTAPDGRTIINARSETAAQRPMFRDGMTARRCAIPASHSFEWARRGRSKEKYAIGPSDGGTTYLAGVYRLTGGMPEFAVLTRAPADAIAFIHDRMPVILPEALVAEWIDPKSDPAALLERAVEDVACRREDGGDEQLGMDLPGFEL